MSTLLVLTPIHVRAKDTKQGTHPKVTLAKTGVPQGTVTTLFGALGAALVGGGILFLRRKNGR